ncbi:MAG TPA: FG-GAP-like repeat-containing protein [Azospirillaceae bacterium]|nr:FG-GAP-like repeat-containing protein [Azospirillaceae bacterium]
MPLFQGTDLNDTLTGGSGDDELRPGFGRDTVDGGLGSDLLVVDYGSLTDGIRYESSGTFRTLYSGGFSSFSAPNLVSYRNIERVDLRGTRGNDQLEGTSGNDTLRGGDGNDGISGFGGVDLIDGGSGIDAVGLSYGSVQAPISITLSEDVTLFDGTRLISIEALYLTTGSGNDSIVAGSGDDSIVTGAGDDVIVSGLGRDTVDGGSGSDLLVVDYSSLTTGIDYESSGTFRTLHTGGFSSFSATSLVSYRNIERINLTGTRGNDVLEGTTGNDTLRGGDGNDIIFGLGGVEVIDGGAGTDVAVLDYAAVSSSVSIALSEDVVLFDGTRLTNIEALRLTTGGGNDTVSGAAGNDSILTGAGNDRIDAGLGRDAVDGGSGTDLLVVDYSGLTEAIRYDSDGTFRTLYSGGFSSFSATHLVNYRNIERVNLLGTRASDVLEGVSGNDTLRGGAGNDTINGLDGVDTAVFTGAQSGYTVTRNADNSFTVRHLNGGTDGTDTLTNVERLQFADRLVTLVPSASEFLLRRTDGELIAWDQTKGAAGFAGLGNFGAGSSVAGVADFSGDGQADVLIRNADGSQIILNPAAGTQQAVPGFGLFQQVAVGNFTGSAGADVLLRNAAGTLIFYDPSTTAGANPFKDFITPAANFRLVGTGNIDNTGFDDVVFQNTGTGGLLYWNGSQFRDLLTLAPNSGWSVQAVGNFLGDGAADFLLFNQNNRVMIFWDATKGSAGFADFITLGQGSSVLNAGDFNGDGRDDILIQTGQSAVYWTGTGFVDASLVVTPGVSLVGIGDFG